MIIAPSLPVLSIYINVYAITIHIMPDTFGYIWLAVSATTVILRGCAVHTIAVLDMLLFKQLLIRYYDREAPMFHYHNILTICIY